MKNNIKTSCKHKYLVGYSFRMPQPFFRNLPCDNCGCRIKLSFPWRLLYIFISIIGLMIVFGIVASIHIRLLGNTFLVSLVIFILLNWIIEQLKGLILRHGKWVEVE